MQSYNDFILTYNFYFPDRFLKYNTYIPANINIVLLQSVIYRPHLSKKLIDSQAEPSFNTHDTNIQKEKCSYIYVFKNESTNQKLKGNETAAKL